MVLVVVFFFCWCSGRIPVLMQCAGDACDTTYHHYHLLPPHSPLAFLSALHACPSVPALTLSLLPSFCHHTCLSSFYCCACLHTPLLQPCQPVNIVHAHAWLTWQPPASPYLCLAPDPDTTLCLPLLRWRFNLDGEFTIFIAADAD